MNEMLETTWAGMPVEAENRPSQPCIPAKKNQVLRQAVAEQPWCRIQISSS